MDVVGLIPGKVTLNQRLVCEFIRGALGIRTCWGGIGWKEGLDGSVATPMASSATTIAVLELTPFGAWRLDFNGPISTWHQMQVDPGKW